MIIFMFFSLRLNSVCIVDGNLCVRRRRVSVSTVKSSSCCHVVVLLPSSGIVYLKQSALCYSGLTFT